MERLTQAPVNFRPIDLYTDCKSVIAVGIALPKGLLRVSLDCYMEPRGRFGSCTGENVRYVTDVRANALGYQYLAQNLEV